MQEVDKAKSWAAQASKIYQLVRHLPPHLGLVVRRVCAEHGLSELLEKEKATERKKAGRRVGTNDEGGGIKSREIRSGHEATL